MVLAKWVMSCKGGKRAVEQEQARNGHKAGAGTEAGQAQARCKITQEQGRLQPKAGDCSGQANKTLMQRYGS